MRWWMYVLVGWLVFCVFVSVWLSIISFDASPIITSRTNNWCCDVLYGRESAVRCCCWFIVSVTTTTTELQTFVWTCMILFRSEHLSRTHTLAFCVCVCVCDELHSRQHHASIKDRAQSLLCVCAWVTSYYRGSPLEQIIALRTTSFCFVFLSFVFFWYS